jgi:hypothetical protein
MGKKVCRIPQYFYYLRQDKIKNAPKKYKKGLMGKVLSTMGNFFLFYFWDYFCFIWGDICIIWGDFCIFWGDFCIFWF